MIDAGETRFSYTGDGHTTGPYTVACQFQDEAFLDVYVAGVKKTLNVDYTVTGEADPDGGAVTFAIAPAASAAIVIERNTAVEQDLIDLNAGGDFSSSAIESAFDKLTMIAQEHDRDIAAALKAEDGVAFDAGGKRITGLADGTEATDAVTLGQLTPWVTTVSDLATAAQGSATLASQKAVAAGVSQVEAAGSAEDAAEDAAQVALDRIAVAADKVTVAADKGLTAGYKDTAVAAAAAASDDADSAHDDAIQTAADRIAVAADKATVASDKDTVATNTALTEGYKNAAEEAAENAAAVSGLTNLGSVAVKVATAADVVATASADSTTDVDAGAWRKKVAAVSWMTETLSSGNRGGRAEFPSRSSITVQSTSALLSVWDNDDPTSPYWKKWTIAGGTWAAYSNGHIYYAGTGGLYDIDLILDKITRYDLANGVAVANQNVATYNQGTATWRVVSATGIVNATVNSIASTILPGTPLNPLRCNLPNPTVAVATAGGVSVIWHDGVVANVTGSGGANYSVAVGVKFTPNNRLMINMFFNGFWRAIYDIDVPRSTRTVAQSAISPDYSILGAGVDTTNTAPHTVVADFNGGIATLSNNRQAVGALTGVVLADIDNANHAGTSIVNITTTYNTGWMPPSTKLALAESSAGVTSLVGGTAADRSVNATTVNVNGTVTRTVVATGADVAAYGGFSASNYLEVSYSANFDMATDDFAIVGWIKEAPNSATETILERDSASTGQRWTLAVTAAGLLQWIVDDGTTTATSATAAIDDSTWKMFVVGKRGALQVVYLNGVLADSDTAPTLTLNNASAVLRVGECVAGGAPLTNGSVAELRVAKGFFPTPDQIARMYAEELPLFQANAKCLLSGTVVQGLAYDTDTDLLYAANSTAGTDVFKGLQRLRTIGLVTDKISSLNHNAVSASGGIVTLTTAAEAYAELPAIGLRERIDREKVCKPYDPTVIPFSGVTTYATQTTICKIPMAEYRAFGLRIDISVAQYGTRTERGRYRIDGLAIRDIGGNVTVDTPVTTTISETTAGMDVTIAADTTAQTIDIKVTGKAATRLTWDGAAYIVEANRAAA